MRILFALVVSLLVVGCSGSCSESTHPSNTATNPARLPDESTVYLMHQGKRIECPVPHASWNADTGELTILATQHKRPGLGDPPSVRLVLKIKDHTVALSQANLESVRLSFEQMPNAGNASMKGSNTLKAIRAIKGNVGEGEQVSLDVEYGFDATDNPTDVRGKILITIQ
jgi:hypothetical protein